MSQIVPIIRRHWIPLLGFNSVMLAATAYAATIYADLTFSPMWQANAKLNLPQITSGLNANLGTLGNIQNTGSSFSKEINPLQIQASIITSETVLERLRSLDPQKNSFPTINSYKGLITVTPQEQSTIISLEVQGSSPQIARQRLLMLIEIYQQRLNELRRNDNVVREKFSQPELEQARINLVQTQTALSQFKQSTGLFDSDAQSKALVSAINNLRTSQATAIAQAQSNQSQAQAAAASLGITPQQAMNSLRLSENKDYLAIRDKLSQLEATLAEARSKYRDDSPQVESLMLKRQELLNSLKQQISAIVPGATVAAVDKTLGNSDSQNSRKEIVADLVRKQTEAQGLRQQASQLQVQVDKLNAQLRNISTNQAQLSYLQRRYEIAEGVYKAIIAQAQQAKTNPFIVYPNVQTLDEPSIDPTPTKPKRWLSLIGGVLATVCGSIALVLFRESRNPLFSLKDLEHLAFPVLESIPRLKQPNMEGNLEADITIEFQRLASAVLMQEKQRIMVTSATAGEGKTTITLGLALALVNFGFRVLIVDGDLRQSEISRRLGYFQTPNQNQQNPVSIYPGLDLLPAPSIAKDKVAKYFACGSFEQCLSNIQESGGYDYVLVDSAPVGLASESNLMSAVLRNILFVVRSGKSDRYSVMSSIEQLTRHNVQMMGLVVNGVESRTNGYNYKRQRELLEAEA